MLNSRLLKLRKQIKTRNQLLLTCTVAVGLVVGTTGVALQLLTHALSTTTSVQAENGTRSSQATRVTDVTASGGQAVKFSPASSGTWTLLYNVDLSQEPSGTNYTVGTRPTTDQSYNRQQQVSYGANGMTITAQDISGTIYSADVLMKGLPMPNHHAMEWDTTFTGYLGAGMFPAVWERPQSAGTGSGSGEGERDIWEYAGGYVGQDNEWKMTDIATPYSKTGQPHQNQVVDQFAPDFQTEMGTRTPLNVTLHWRVEYILNTATLYLNGTQIAQETKAEYDSNKNGGVTNADYDNTNYGYDRWLQFETTGKTWYPRFTYQIGNGTGSSLGGIVPASWTQSQMIINNLKIYKLSSE